MSCHEARTGSSLERCTALAERALTLPPGEDTAAIFAYVGLVLAVADRADEGRALCDRRLDYARSTGSVFEFAIASWLRGITAYLLGDIGAAEADQRQAIAAGEEHGLSAGLIYGYARLAEELLERGELEEAEATLAVVGCAEPLPPLAHFDWWLHARSQLRLAQGRHREALHDAKEVGRRYESLGGVNPAFLAWRSTTALASLALCDDQAAADLAEEEVRLADAWGAPGPLGHSVRVAGMARKKDALALLQRSREVLADSRAALEHARTLVELGVAQHDIGEREVARETLWEGLELGRRCGALTLVRRAHESLVAAGARPRRTSRSGPHALTPTERRVAGLAADGRSNREIAADLFVTPKTIEKHLGNVYRKLEISSRTQLPSALPRSDADEEADVKLGGKT